MDDAIYRQYRTRLAELIRERALRFGDFLLASGQRSSYFIDGKAVTMCAEGAYLLARLILRELEGLGVEAVGGMAIGADPIAGAVAAVSFAQGQPLDAFIVRKERKERGMGDQVAGPVREGARVAMVEDTITTGGSTLKAIEALREERNAEIAAVIVMVDRLQGARENLASANYELRAIFDVRELGVRMDGDT
jgi:orotate phosphoribosyltransferase